MAAVRSAGIPDGVIEEVVARTDIVSLVGQYVKFPKTSGANLFGLCPFHSEDTPSFSVSKNKQIYYCFGCHKGGNAIHFIMEIEKCSFLDAVKLLAEKAGVPIPEPEDDGYREKAKIRDRVLEALLEAARYFYKHFQAPEGKTARTYLEKRGISSSSAKAFGLGYSPEDWTGLYRHLRGLGFADEVLIRSGLFTKRDNGELLDLFRGRLMFPIFDVMGRVIAFGGRILTDGNPKYINSPESAVYSKQRNLYALNFAKNTKEKKLIVAEGYMDVISMHQAGLTNAVAPLGTALTDLQLKLISRYTQEIVFFFDSDRAGQQAALRGLQMLLEKNRRQTNASLLISVARVPDGKDPDEYIRTHGPASFRELLADAYSVLEYLLFTAKTQATENDHLDLRVYKDLACTYLSWETDAVLRERGAREAATIMGVSVESVLKETEKSQKGISDERRRTEIRERERSEQEIVRQETEKKNFADKEEIQIICLLSQLGETCKKLQDPPFPSEFSEGIMRDIAEDALAAMDRGKLDAGNLMDICEGRTLNARSAREVFSEALITLESVTGENLLLAQTEMFILRRKRRVYSERKKFYLQRLSETTDETQRETMQEYYKRTNEYWKHVEKRLRMLSDG